jgi:rhodanese-related sulfurtransferase
MTIKGILLLLLSLPGSMALAQASSSTAQPAVKQIDIEQFDKMRTQKDTVVLDVRTSQEYRQGHVPGSANIDISDPQFRQKVADLDKSRTYLVHCARGVRSARATKMMATMGFANLYDFHGGFDEWKRAGKPVEKPAPEQEKQVLILSHQHFPAGGGGDALVGRENALEIERVGGNDRKCRPRRLTLETPHQFDGLGKGELLSGEAGDESPAADFPLQLQSTIDPHQ